MPIQFEMPMRLKSIANASQQGNWRQRAKDKRQQRQNAFLYSIAAISNKRNLLPRDLIPAKVTIVRVGKKMMDDDNLAISAKAVRDGVADALGVDDGDRTKVTWAYDQEIGKAYAVKVSIQ